MTSGTNQTERNELKAEEERSEFLVQLQNSIVEGMKDVLGEGGMQAAMFHLQLIQYAKDPKNFHENLYSLFKEGSIVLEKVIVKELYMKLGIPFNEREEFDFERCINLAVQIIASRPGGTRSIER